MGKVITSPVSDFPGTITLKENITMALLAQYDDAKIAAVTGGGRSEWARNIERFKSIVAMCERWDIEGQPELPTAESFSTKNADGDNKADEARRLFQWLVHEINLHIGMETNIPKFLQPEPISTPKTPEATANPAN